MSLVDILSQYAESALPKPDTEQHYDAAVKSASPDTVAAGLSDTFRSDRTPPFADMVAQLFQSSNPAQRAGVLNQLLQTVGPAVFGSLAGKVFGQGAPVPAAGAQPGTPTSLTPEQAQQVTPEQVREIATQAQERDPTIVDQLGSFYGRHPDLVKGIGASVLAVLLGKLAKR